MGNRTKILELLGVSFDLISIEICGKSGKMTKELKAELAARELADIVSKVKGARSVMPKTVSTYRRSQ